MSGRDPSRGPDPDDWFAGPAGAPRARSREAVPAADEATVVRRRLPPAGDEDWLDDDAARRAGRPNPLANLSVKRQRALAVGAAAVLLLVIGLVVSGVFSGGGKKPATTSTTSPGTTQSTPTQPTRPARPAATAPTTTLKPGDQGAQVKLLQRALVRLGYAAGTADGVYGPSTKTAVSRFQTASSLTADGVVGPQTLQAIATALQSRG
jgi:hypothetical protein